VKRTLKVFARWLDATEKMMLLEASEFLVPAYSVAAE
jgi:hypothetical protein